MDPFRLAKDAVLDVDAIWLYLRDREGEETALRIVAELFRAFHKLAKIPNSGHRRSDLTSQNVLFSRIFSYLVIYVPASKPLRILSVLHGKRNVARILARRL